jgi:hypothetical protein
MMNMQSLDKDCLAVGSAASFEEHRDWRAILTQHEAGGLRKLRGLRKPATDASSYVRLAFLDTAPDNDTPQPTEDVPFAGPFTIPPPDATAIAADGRVTSTEAFALCGGRPCSPHGYSLITMAQKFLCSGPECGSVHFTARTALPRVNVKGQLSQRREVCTARGCAPKGGLVGYMSDLAEAIDAEVRTFDEVPAASRHLILNLSVGWEPCFGGQVVSGHLANSPAGVHAVHDALRHAACRKALVVAAAGNFQGSPTYAGPGGTPAGPTFPGGWEALPREGIDACAVDAAPTEYTPLLYAVGGVDATDHPIANTRPWSRPRLVAFSDHAADGFSNAILTGTSVGTAIVSSAAARTWAVTPTLTAAQVMGAVWHGGEPLASRMTAQFWCGATPPAAAAGAGKLLTGCGAMPSAETRRIYVRGERPSSSAATIAKGRDIPPGDGDWTDETELALPATLGSPGTDPDCRDEQAWAPKHKSVADCAHWKHSTLSATPWGGPQPDNDPCPTCTHKGSNGPVFITLTPGFTIDGQAVSAPTEMTLVVGTDVTDTDWNSTTAPGRRYTLDLGLSFVSGDNTDLVCIDAADDESMFLSMKVIADGEERVLVAPVLMEHWGSSEPMPNPCSP